MNFKQTGAIALVALAMAGCSTPLPRHDRAAVQQLVDERAPAVPASPDAEGILGEAHLLTHALTDSPRARAIWAQWDIDTAVVRQALTLHNPVLGVLRMSGDGALRQTSWSLSQELLDLLFTGYRRRQGMLAAQQARQQGAAQLLALWRDLRLAYVAHAAAAQAAQVAGREREAARLAADLAAGYLRAGNISELALRREEAAANEAALRAIQRGLAQASARAALLDLAGIADSGPDLRIDSTLRWRDDPPGEEAALLAQAAAQRLDLAALRSEVALREAQSTRLRRWRYLPSLTLKAERETASGANALRGGGIDAELPLFDRGAPRIQHARGLLALRDAQLAALATHIHNDVVLQRAAVLAQREAATRHGRQLVEAQGRIFELTQQRADFMLVGSIELLQARARQIAAWQLQVEAVAALAQAQVRLEQAIGGRHAGDIPTYQTLSMEDLP